MTTLLRLQFKRMPTPKTLATILATASLDDAFEGSDFLRDDEDSE